MAAVERETPPPQGAADRDAPPKYLLSTRVPSYWIPLLPVQVRVAPDRIVSRLRRGAVLQPDGSGAVHHARGRLLNAQAALSLYDEEIPREGIRLTRHYQMARWIDGATFVWQANRKVVGRGEGASGLQFDSLDPPDGA